MAIIDRYELSRGTSYAVARGWGCNLFSWIVDGRELMSCPAGLPDSARKITGGGAPILFPAVGRTWDLSSGEPVPGRYRVHGLDGTYTMPSHGIVFASEFARVDVTESPDRITATYQLRVPENVRAENYPFDVGLTQRFVFTPTSVELTAAMTNHGDTAAPVAFGYHPYFGVSSPERVGVEARLPITRSLLLTKDTVQLTGESEPADGVMALEAGRYYDNVFGGITGRRMQLIDRLAGHTINVDFDESVELLVVYAPDGADFMCLEPWTRGLGGFGSLREPGWEKGESVPVLQPGEIRTFTSRFSVGQ